MAIGDIVSFLFVFRNQILQMKDFFEKHFMCWMETKRLLENDQIAIGLVMLLYVIDLIDSQIHIRNQSRLSCTQTMPIEQCKHWN